MTKAIFTTEIKATAKFPKRIKVHMGGVPTNYVYQEELTPEENHILAAQDFSKQLHVSGFWFAGTQGNGYVFVPMNPALCFDENICFLDNKTIVRKSGYETITIGNSKLRDK